MAVPTVAEFRAYWGNMFSYGDVYPTAFVQARLDDACDEISSVTFGKYYTRAVMNLTAHFLTLFMNQYQMAQLAPGSSAVSTNQGIVTSVSIGDLTHTIEIPEYSGKDDKFLASTSFGQEFIRLRNKMSRGPLIANQSMLTDVDPYAIEGSYP